MTREAAAAALRQLTGGLEEQPEAQAVERLLERVAQADPELRAVLLEAGAKAVLHGTAA